MWCPLGSDTLSRFRLGTTCKFPRSFTQKQRECKGGKLPKKQLPNTFDMEIEVVSNNVS